MRCSRCSIGVADGVGNERFKTGGCVVGARRVAQKRTVACGGVEFAGGMSSSALLPAAALWLPVVLFWSALTLAVLLLPVVLFPSALTPMAVSLLPVVFSASA